MNTYYVAGIPYSDELFHHGIKGQKWGVRRYMNEDGTLTPAGIARYGTKKNFIASQMKNKAESSKSPKSRVGGFVSRHKKGTAIVGSLLAAGVGAIIVSKAIKNRNNNKGLDIVRNVFSPERIKITNPEPGRPSAAPIIQVSDYVGNGKGIPKELVRYMNRR